MIEDMLSENSTLREVLSQSNISVKYLDLLINNSRKSLDKIGIGY